MFGGDETSDIERLSRIPRTKAQRSDEENGEALMRWIRLAVIAVLVTVAVSLAMLYEPETDTPRAASLAVAQPVRSEGPPPKLELLGQPVYNFGTMPKHAKSAHTWEIKNAGQGPLQVWLQESSCSCTVAKLDKKGVSDEAQATVEVPPGQSTPIEVSWDTREWSSFTQTATLGTNDPEQPSITLAIRGKVLAAVAVLPSEMVSFPAMTSEDTRSETVSVVSPDRADWKLTKLATSRPDVIVARATPLTAQEVKSLQVAGGYHVVVTVKPGMPPGGFHEQLRIQTDHPNQAELRVPILGKVTGPISAAPERLRMPNVTSRAGATGEVKLMVLGGRPVHFDVAYKPAKLQVAITGAEQPELQGQYRMQVTVPAGTTPGPVVDRIILKTDHPKLSQLEIPVTIYVSRGGAG
jgi:hypothetical protein